MMSRMNSAGDAANGVLAAAGYNFSFSFAGKILYCVKSHRC
jgi:hypothetical protein